jgi:hypothetical protein
MGAILDNACILWEKDCSGNQGSCYEYDSKAMSVKIAFFALIVKILSSSSAFAAWFCYRPEEAVTEKEGTLIPSKGATASETEESEV